MHRKLHLVRWGRFVQVPLPKPKSASIMMSIFHSCPCDFFFTLSLHPYIYFVKSRGFIPLAPNSNKTRTLIDVRTQM